MILKLIVFFQIMLCQKTTSWSQIKRHKYTLSKFFQPFDVIPHNQDTVHNPSEDSISARLLTNYGVVRQAGPGTFHLLPLGLRSVKKIENIIDREMEKIGCLKISMPHVTQASLWKKSGRLTRMGSELITFNDRHERSQVLSPTHEEAVTDLMKSLPVTHDTDLSIKLYQVGTKFRDEMRPKFGLIRSNEFLMKDLYTFDKDIASAQESYHLVTEAYQNIFETIGVPWLRVAGDSGAIGGSMSHEYHYPAPIGQDNLVICGECGHGSNAELLSGDDQSCVKCGAAEVKTSKGIEVGHTFQLGDKYSRSMKAKYKNAAGEGHVYQMGCYGIGVSRLMAAAVEVMSTPSELRWPRVMAPFSCIVLAPKGGSREGSAASGLVSQLCQSLNTVLPDDVILDDREKLTVGKKLREAKKTGYPYIVLFGKKCADEDPMIELHSVNTGEMTELRPEELVQYMKANAVSQP